KTVARADHALRLDRQCAGAQHLIVGHQDRALLAERQRDNLGLLLLDQQAAGLDLVGSYLERRAKKVAQLAQARLDQIGASRERSFQRRSRTIDDNLSTSPSRRFHDATVKIV